MKHSVLLTLSYCLVAVFAGSSKLVPTIIPKDGVVYRDNRENGHFYREIFIDGQTAYVGARNFIYKIDLKSPSNNATSLQAQSLGTDFTSQFPEFGPNRQYGHGNETSSAFQQARHRMVDQRLQIQLEATERLAETFKIRNGTFYTLCVNQSDSLRMYYGESLSMPLYNASVLCARHARGLAKVNVNGQLLFGLKTGLFGSLTAAPTGVNDFNRGYSEWYRTVRDDADPYPHSSIPVRHDDSLRADYGDVTAPLNAKRRAIWKKQFDMGNRCYKCENATSYEDPRCLRGAAVRAEEFIYPTDRPQGFMKMSGPIVYCFKPRQAINNMMGIYGICDYRQAPNRFLINDNFGMTDSRLPETSRDTCKGGLLASTMFAGYHPDQRTISLYSESANGPSANQKAVYVLTEMGQEKQWDVNHEMFMGYEDPIPSAGSATLALVRLMVTQGGDVSEQGIVMNNPFNRIWVTSPATKFGRLVKTHNQNAVGIAPKAVGLIEDSHYIYVFFREVDWESLHLPAHNSSRYNFNWRAYDHTISFPWEEGRGPRTIFQPEEYVLDGNDFSGFLKSQMEGNSPEVFANISTQANFFWDTYNDFVAAGGLRGDTDIILFRGYHRDFFKEKTSGRYNYAGNRDASPLYGYTKQYVYGPTLEGYDHLWRAQKTTTRIARVCKNDPGLPMGTIDGSYFNLDNHLSLSAFQTFIKTRLRCAVRLPAVPRIWRLRKDVASFWFNGFLNMRHQWHDENKTVEWYQKEYPECTYFIPADRWFGNRSSSMCGSIIRLTSRQNPLVSLTEAIKSIESDVSDGCMTPIDFTEVYPGVFRGPHCSFMNHGLNVAFRQFIRDYGVPGSYFFKDSLYKNHLSGFNQYFWQYVAPKIYSSTAYYYSELRDLKKVGDTYYGVFTSESVDEIERLRAADLSGDFTPPAPNSALCAFTSDQIKVAFEGPFKKKEDNAYRPVDPENITPSPYSCDADPITAEAYSINKMNIQGFSDESLPLEDEMKDFDMRRKSTRAAFFDDENSGSRTMWRDIDAQSISIFNGVALDRMEHTTVTTDKRYEVLFLATIRGELFKVVTWHNEPGNHEQCYETKGDDLTDWWKTKSSLFYNEWQNYFNLTQESGTKLPDDLLFKSTWAGCSHLHNHHRVLAKIQPFEGDTRIWSLKLSQENLLLGTDTQVLKLSTSMCGEYKTCQSCAIDPFCGWNAKDGACERYSSGGNGLIQNVTGHPECGACLRKMVKADLSNNVMLDVGFLAPERQFVWYRNDTQLEERPLRYLLLRNSSLVILNVSPGDKTSIYELKDKATGDCIIQYTLAGGDCPPNDISCMYENKYRTWCDQYDDWYFEMTRWQSSMKKLGCTVD